MLRTSKRYFMPLLWAVIGCWGSVLADQMERVLSGYWRPVIHFHEVAIGLLFGVLRWTHGEWRFEQIYASRKMEIDMRNALHILRHSDDEEAKADALQFVLDALVHRPFHPDFSETLENEEG